MAPQITCTKCSERYGPTNIVDRYAFAPVCRFCQLADQGKADIESLKSEMSTMKQAGKEAKERIDLLERKMAAKDDEIKTLREFITANIAVGSSSGVATLEQRSYRDVAATPAEAPVPASSNDRVTEGFQVVRNNVRPKVRNVLEPVVCHNRFKILTDNADEEEEEVRLVGDSIINGQLHEFCARAPKSRKRFCIPGGGLDDVDAALEQVANLAPPNTTYVVHIGTNDVVRTRSEELMEKYKKLIKKFKEKSSNVIMSGILPRWVENQRFLNDATMTNRRLATLCREENVDFVDTWDSFYYDRSLYKNDGLHLNGVGAARLGRLLSDAVEKRRSKNGPAHAQGET